MKDSGPALEAARSLAADVANSKLNDRDRARLGEVLAALTARLSGPQQRRSLLAPALSFGRANVTLCVDLAAASRVDDVSVLAEMIQWPQCVERTDETLMVAEKTMFGTSSPKQRRFPNIAAFIAWVDDANKSRKKVADLERRPPNPFTAGLSGWFGISRIEKP